MRFLRQPSRPNAPRPDTNNGSAAGRGVVVRVPVNDPVSALVAIVTVSFEVSVPVSPANAPVPPVKIKLITLLEVVPLFVPVAVKVPNRVPSPKVSVKVPFVRLKVV